MRSLSWGRPQFPGPPWGTSPQSFSSPLAPAVSECLGAQSALLILNCREKGVIDTIFFLNYLRVEALPNTERETQNFESEHFIVREESYGYEVLQTIGKR